jgi:small subunit ribosomal protein S4
MIRKANKYSRPKKAYEKARIQEENALAKKYALKSKREIWKTLAKVNYFRKRAMALAKSPAEEQEVLFKKLTALGLKVSTISDVLALKLEDLLERRLSTIVFKKNLSKTTKHARQLITHKIIMIDNKVVNAPSYLVSVSEEALISLKQKAKKPKVVAEAPAEGSAPVEVKEVTN